MTVANPCVRHCCLNEQDICLGCFRSLSEITGWTRMDTVQRLRILDLSRHRRQLHAKNHPGSLAMYLLNSSNDSEVGRSNK
ncbi:MAG: DUF1289 domain-containing protein [Motiliproteus sp.]|nr:DUF1289 domain-containing protein [Motiliproteus sp.]MCW9052062.1 DUF1289 domain-containing protein [Motiliproteus sp.]